MASSGAISSTPIPGQETAPLDIPPVARTRTFHSEGSQKKHTLHNLPWRTMTAQATRKIIQPDNWQAITCSSPACFFSCVTTDVRNSMGSFCWTVETIPLWWFLYLAIYHSTQLFSQYLQIWTEFIMFYMSLYYNSHFKQRMKTGSQPYDWRARQLNFRYILKCITLHSISFTTKLFILQHFLTLQFIFLHYHCHHGYERTLLCLSPCLAAYLGWPCSR